MRAFADAATTHFLTQMRRHLRAPGLLYLAFLAPLIAIGFVPGEGASYAMIGVNERVPRLTPSTIGLILGVLTATLLSPLAYIYLRAGPTARQPVTAQTPTPASRRAQMLGYFTADTAALWIWLAVLGASGVILSAFRTGTVGWIVPVVLFAVAASALAVTAAVRTLFSARPVLRGAMGDIAFFFVWTFGIAMSVAFVSIGASPIADVFGYAAPITYGTAVPVETLYVAGAPIGEGVIDIDAWAGVSHPDYLGSRAAWLAICTGIALLAGTVFKPSPPPRAKAVPRTEGTPSDANPNPRRPLPRIPGTGMAGTKIAGPMLDVNGLDVNGLVTIALAHMREIASGWMRYALIAAAVAGGVFAFFGYGGIAVIGALVFAVAAQSPIWRGRETVNLIGVTPGATHHDAAHVLAVVALAALICAPATIRAVVTGDSASALLIAATLGGVAILWAMGRISGSAVPGRLLGFMAWYAVVNAVLA